MKNVWINMGLFLFQNFPENRILNISSIPNWNFEHVRTQFSRKWDIQILLQNKLSLTQQERKIPSYSSTRFS